MNNNIIDDLTINNFFENEVGFTNIISEAIFITRDGLCVSGGFEMGVR